MDFMTSVKTCLSKYADFNGRARRSEFWWFYLAVVVAAVVSILIADVLYYLVILATVVPTLAAGSRRLHDTGKTGWLQLVGLIPLVGGILLIVWYASDSQPGANQYGPNPKELAANGGTWGTPPPPPPSDPFAKP